MNNHCAHVAAYHYHAYLKAMRSKGRNRMMDTRYAHARFEGYLYASNRHERRDTSAGNAR